MVDLAKVASRVRRASFMVMDTLLIEVEDLIVNYNGMGQIAESHTIHTGEEGRCPTPTGRFVPVDVL